MRKLYIVTLLLSVVFSAHAAAAQSTGTVKGRVVDSHKKGIEQATVLVKGTNIYSTTDNQGYFVLKDTPAGNVVLAVSRVGAERTEINIDIKATGETQVDDIVVKNGIKLRDVFITGKTEVREQQEQAYAVSIVDLSKSYNTSADMGKLLNEVASVRIAEEGGVGSGYKFSINGFTGNQVKIFMDGLPIDNFGSSFGLTDLPANMASRIEVYKGVLPANLGMDALGGAVNIITRKDANYLDASYSFGSFNTHKASLNGAYTNKDNGFTVRLNSYYNYSDNDYKVWVPILNLQTSQYEHYDWVRRFHDQYQSVGAKLEAGVTGRRYADNLLFGLLVSDNESEVQNGQTMTVAYGGITRGSRSIVPTVRYSKDDLFVKGLSFSFYGAYNTVEDSRADTLARRYNWYGDWVPNPSPTTGENSRTLSTSDVREWLTTANLRYAINDHHALTLNSTFSDLTRRNDNKLDPDNNTNRKPQMLDKNIVNLGYMAEYRKWNATVFSKYYHLYNSAFREIKAGTADAYMEEVSRRKGHLGYGGAAMYFFTPTFQAKASYERAYRLPQSGEIFGDGMFTRDNLELKPEKSDNVNFGISYYKWLTPDHFLDLSTTLLYRNTTDYINQELNQSGNSNSSRNVNRGKVRTLGIEGSVKYACRGLFHAGATVTYQDITDQQKMIDLTGSFNQGVTDNPNYGYRIANTPVAFGNFDAGFSFSDVVWKNTTLTLDYGLYYMQEYFLNNPGLGSADSKEVIPEQLYHNASMTYAMAGGRYNISLECRNLTDEKLYDNYMLQKPGRSFSLKIRYFLQ